MSAAPLVDARIARGRKPALGLAFAWTCSLLTGCTSVSPSSTLVDAPEALVPCPPSGSMNDPVSGQAADQAGDPLTGLHADATAMSDSHRAALARLEERTREISRQLPAPPERPCDPWVVRGPLDGRPDVLVIALGQRLWLAYDPATCALIKAWRGDVDEDGPLDTMANGPQPVARGEVLRDPLAGSQWLAAPGVPARVRFAGSTLDGGRVTLHWEIGDPRDAGAPAVIVRETPEVARSPDGRLTLLRLFDGTTVGAQQLILSAPFLPQEGPPRLEMDAVGFGNTWDFVYAATEQGQLFQVHLAHGMGLLSKTFAAQRVP
jgi:hypothetical protein